MNRSYKEEEAFGGREWRRGNWEMFVYGRPPLITVACGFGVCCLVARVRHVALLSTLIGVVH